MIAKNSPPVSTIGGQKEGIQMTSRLIARTGLIGVAVALAVGAVYATIPDAGGVIHGCYGRSGGGLRVIDDSVTACKPNETALEWSAGGPQVSTVGTTGNGTANDLTVPDLGTLHTECSASGFGSITLNGDALFDLVKVTDEAASLVSLRLDRATYSNSGPETLGSAGAELWVTNVQGQWRFEYYALTAGGPMGDLPPCKVGAVITRIG